MVKKVITLAVMIPLGVILIVLSVANRQSVTLALNPFRPDDQLLALAAPFFVFLFSALILGLVIGSTVTWFTQAKYRKLARTEAREAVKWHEEADRQKSRAEQISGRTYVELAK
ncbi:DUF1049 domain-containing protein [Rhizobiaceae bacterium n13]|uniref:DUF1049 domain-containing protein n=1 Tax=Ferirhizobium litorale TaxID=2927786 RepID=A0AAE3QKT7_9HYPH|nr:DUF1049 domain-containing protein [Fererhizobium litorale]MDI7864740.1 DUF1049 domain-containing protein [Fererhizobium litorale]MDI7924979.1 DUF1049 domain-containing protein [Fererhizobium litorale]